MPRLVVYCRYPKCGYVVEVSEGRYPSHCANCGRSQRWTLRPPDDDGESDPMPYLLTPLDRKLLHSFHISEE